MGSESAPLRSKLMQNVTLHSCPQTDFAMLWHLAKKIEDLFRICPNFNAIFASLLLLAKYLLYQMAKYGTNQLAIWYHCDLKDKPMTHFEKCPISSDVYILYIGYNVCKLYIVS